MANEWQARLGTLIRKYRTQGGMTQGTLAQLVSDKAGKKVAQAVVSANELGTRWDIELLGAYVEALGIPEQEWRDALHMPVVASDPEGRPKGFAQTVAADETLSRAAKEHLLNQYELLQMATQHERRGEPVLHQDRQRKRKGA